MKKQQSKKKIIRSAVFIALGVLLIWWQLSSMGTEEKTEFISALKNANFIYILPVAIFAIASHFFRSLRWRLLMEPLGYFPSIGNTFACTLIGNTINSALPRVGEIAKCTILAEKEKFHTDQVIGTIIMERLFDVMCYALFILFTFFLQTDIFYQYISKELANRGTGGLHDILKPLIYLLLISAAVVFLLVFLLKKYPENRIFRKVKNILIGLKDGFISILKMKKVGRFLVFTFFVWLFYLAQIYIGFNAMDGVAHLGFKEACAVLTLATLAMVITPGGLGSFPFFVMQTLLLFNIPSPTGKAFGFLMWGISTLIVIFTGFASWLLLPYLKNGTQVHPNGRA